MTASRTKPPAFGRLWPADIPANGEDFDRLADGGGARVERIRSAPDANPGPWYDQDGDEWVVLIQGGAELEFADQSRRVLAPGDWALLPAGLRHRVARVMEPSLWLAFHFPF